MIKNFKKLPSPIFRRTGQNSLGQIICGEEALGSFIHLITYLYILVLRAFDFENS